MDRLLYLKALFLLLPGVGAPINLSPIGVLPLGQPCGKTGGNAGAGDLPDASASWLYHRYYVVEGG